MKQNIKLNYFLSNKFDQPNVFESNCLKCVEEHLETSRNVKLTSYKSQPFDTPKNSKIEETVVEIPMCIGFPIYHCVTLEDIDGTRYKRPYNCIFVLCVFVIISSIYFYCFFDHISDKNKGRNLFIFYILFFTKMKYILMATFPPRLSNE